MTFDPHAEVKKLQAVGVPLEQAEGIVNMVRDTHRVDLSSDQALLGRYLATKADLATALKDLEQRLKIWFGGGMILLGGFLAAIKYFG